MIRINKYKTINLSTSGNKLVEKDGLPEALLKAINENWINKNNNVTAILLESQEVKEWLELGNKLITASYSSAEYIGLALNGTVPDQMKLWIKEFFIKDSKEGIVGIIEQNTKHPIKPEIIISNSTLVAIQNKLQMRWIENLWDNASSVLFNGCDMIFTSYSSDKVLIDIIGETFNLEIFLSTLLLTESWIIPLDEYLGFIVGFNRNSTFAKGINKLMF